MKSSLSSDVFLECAAKIESWAKTALDLTILEKRSSSLIGYLKVNMARLIGPDFLSKLSVIEFVPAISYIDKQLVFTSFKNTIIEKDVALAFTVLPVIQR